MSGSRNQGARAGLASDAVDVDAVDLGLRRGTGTRRPLSTPTGCEATLGGRTVRAWSNARALDPPSPARLEIGGVSHRAGGRERSGRTDPNVALESVTSWVSPGTSAAHRRGLDRSDARSEPRCPGGAAGGARHGVLMSLPTWSFGPRPRESEPRSCTSHIGRLEGLVRTAVVTIDNLVRSACLAVAPVSAWGPTMPLCRLYEHGASGRPLGTLREPAAGTAGASRPVARCADSTNTARGSRPLGDIAPPGRASRRRATRPARR